LGEILQRYGETFNGTPVSLPIPTDAPAEIPRIILQSSDGIYKGEFSPARTNIFMYRKTDNVEELDIENFFNFSTELFLQFLSIVKGKTGRLAAVLIRYVQKENPGIFLSRYFLKEKWIKAPFNRPQSFEIHSHKRYIYKGKYNINSWVRCKTGYVEKIPKEPIILIEQDINTFPEEMTTKEFSYEEIKDFYSTLAEEFDSILSLYFPNGGLING